MHISGRYILNLAQFAAQQGADLKALIASSGSTYEDLCVESSAVPIEVYDRVLKKALDLTGDQLFGFHLGQHLNLSAAGLIVQIAQTSETVKQALEYCCEFANLSCSSLTLHLSVEKNFDKVLLTPKEEWLTASPESVYHTVFVYLVFTIREFHTLTHQQYFPDEIRVIFPRPEQFREIDRALGCRVKYNQNEISLIFLKKHLREKVVTSDFRLLRILVDYAQERLDENQLHKSFYEKVKRSVVHLVSPTFPTLQQIAAHLNMSPRTLQRRLKVEARSYKELIDDLREDFAIRYLQKPDLNINEISYLLGYADASAFIRSFKRWKGVTPGEFRFEKK